MDSLGAFPWQWTAAAGWLAGAAWIALLGWRDERRRWLVALCALCGARYATLGLPAASWLLIAIPVLIALFGASLETDEEMRWRWRFGAVVVAITTLEPVGWVLSTTAVVSVLYARHPRIGWPFLQAGLPMLALLLSELLPGMRGLYTAPHVWPAVALAIVICQLWLPAVVIARNGRAL
jgi:hypothetical protein